MNGALHCNDALLHRAGPPWARTVMNGCAANPPRCPPPVCSLHCKALCVCVMLPNQGTTISAAMFQAWNENRCSVAFSSQPLPVRWPFKSGSCLAANHSLNIFPNRNLMTPGNLCLILALPKIVVRPQIWHDRAPSRRPSGLSALSLLLACTAAASQL